MVCGDAHEHGPTLLNQNIRRGASRIDPAQSMDVIVTSGHEEEKSCHCDAVRAQQLR
jgi:hypothetical protein